MDIVVSKAPEEGGWDLTDLLGRAMGRIIEMTPDLFVIEPAGGAVETMTGMKSRHPSLDAALAQIETHTRGVCRRDWDTAAGQP